MHCHAALDQQKIFSQLITFTLYKLMSCFSCALKLGVKLLWDVLSKRSSRFKTPTEDKRFDSYIADT